MVSRWRLGRSVLPKGDPTGRMHGVQLWANLPAALKMTKPRYQEVESADIPAITDDDGTHVRLVRGHFWGKTGPVEGIVADPTYLDVSVPPGKRKTLPLAVPTEGVGWWPHATPPAEVDNRALVLFDRGDEVVVQGGENGIRFLLVSGRPLREPVAWYGPIVMNTPGRAPAGIRGT